jgi:putative oxidoreductase
MNIPALVSSGYRLLVRIGNSLQSPLLLLIRLYWGWQFAQNGWGKLHRIPQVTEFFASLGIPMPHANAVFIASLECAGGVLIALGLGSRLISLLLVGDMTVAYITADREALKAIFSDPGKFYNADPYTFWFACLLIFTFGPGYLSLDYLIRKRRAGADDAPVLSRAHGL